MIVLSLGVLAVAGVLLVVGILQGDAGTVTLVASIGTTVLAAVLLYFGVRPRGAAPDRTTPGDRPESRALASVPSAPPAKAAAAAKAPAGAAPAGGHRAPADGRTSGETPVEGKPLGGKASEGKTSGGKAPEGKTATGETAVDKVPAGKAADGTAPAGDTAAAAHDDPPDEPAIERASLGDLARVAARDDEVAVVDGRPRYHLPSCAHLAGRESEGLPVSEAAELGFTPCARCAPVTSLTAR
jgi:hypothetical protein